MIGRRLRQLLSFYKLPVVPDRLEALEKRVAALEHPGKVVSRNEFDMLKSKLDVPMELVDAFFAWKEENPIPDHPLVSVIVATYNRARLLTERCLPSIINQTYDNLEIIVVGDYCTDETAEMMTRIKDPRLKFHNLQARSRYPSDPLRFWMVSGIKTCYQAMEMITGDFVCHLDDDDEYVLERIEKLVTFARENKCDLIWHPFWMEYSDGGWFLNEANDFTLSEITNGSVFYRSWFFKNLKPDDYTYMTMEPGDWNRYRRIKYINPMSMRYPEPLLRHYREGTQREQQSNNSKES